MQSIERLSIDYSGLVGEANSQTSDCLCFCHTVPMAKGKLLLKITMIISFKRKTGKKETNGKNIQYF